MRTGAQTSNWREIGCLIPAWFSSSGRLFTSKPENADMIPQSAVARHNIIHGILARAAGLARAGAGAGVDYSQRLAQGLARLVLAARAGAISFQIFQIFQRGSYIYLCAGARLARQGGKAGARAGKGWRRLRARAGRARGKAGAGGTAGLAGARARGWRKGWQGLARARRGARKGGKAGVYYAQGGKAGTGWCWACGTAGGTRRGWQGLAQGLAVGLAQTTRRGWRQAACQSRRATPSTRRASYRQAPPPQTGAPLAFLKLPRLLRLRPCRCRAGL